MKIIRVVVLLGCLGLIPGCGQSGPEVAEVTGVVTLDGQPLPAATIVFTPAGAEGGRPGTATSDEQGRYTLMFTEDRAGAQLGEHIVSVRTQGEYYDTEGNEHEREELVPAQYNSDHTYKKTVESGVNTINLELKSDG